MRFSPQHRAKLHTTNPLERLPAADAGAEARAVLIQALPDIGILGRGQHFNMLRQLRRDHPRDSRHGDELCLLFIPRS
jgi:hypothetical protein